MKALATSPNEIERPKANPVLIIDHKRTTLVIQNGKYSRGEQGEHRFQRDGSAAHNVTIGGMSTTQMYSSLLFLTVNWVVSGNRAKETHLGACTVGPWLFLDLLLAVAPMNTF